MAVTAAGRSPRRVLSVLVTAAGLVGVLSPADPVGAGPLVSLRQQSSAQRPSNMAYQDKEPDPSMDTAQTGATVILSPEVAALPADSTALDRAESQLGDLTRRRDRAAAEIGSEQSALSTETAELNAVAALSMRRAEQVDKADRLAERTRSTLTSLGVQRFVVGDHLLEGLDPALSAERAQELNRQKVLGEMGTEHLMAQHRYTAARSEDLSADLERLRERSDELRGSSERRSAHIDRLGAEIVSLDAEIVDATSERDAAQLGATVAETDLSTIALDAYWRAARMYAMADPECGVTWTVLAGIGRTETSHGTYRGAAVGNDGVVRPPIFGPELDGSNAFAIVRDSDGGRLDGTASTDRAVGPMQFLPSTWRTVGLDADGDGTADPHDIYDAAASAADYLCRSGPGLTDRARLRTAVLTYNRSQAYADIVLERTDAYAAKVALD